MIDLLLQQARDSHRDPRFLQELAMRSAAVEASEGALGRDQVAEIEAAVARDPAGSFDFDSAGYGALKTPVATFAAGRFETPSIGALRERVQRRAAERREIRATEQGEARATEPVRLWVLLGVAPVTDIGALQAGAGPGTVFQVASQFNCLESPGPHVTPVASYFADYTQGPRAAISAFPGALLRHYAAPAPDGGRFVQTTAGRQVELLEAVCSPGVAEVQSGYLMTHNIQDLQAFVAALEERFDQIQVGVHVDVPVVRGYDWDGAVTGEPRIDQVFTSTLAGGGYSQGCDGSSTYRPVCRSLLRAAYVGTILAAAALGRTKVVLTLIGGGVFGNPVPLIWESILWAVDEVGRAGCGAMDVIVNGRDLERHVRPETVLSDVRARDGAVVRFGAGGTSVWC